MHFVKDKLKNVKQGILFSIFYIRGWMTLIIVGRSNCYFIVGTPLHGNLGDHAIAYAETIFVKKELHAKCIEIPSVLVQKYGESWAKLIGGSQILVHGGGFLGSLWPTEDKMVQFVIKTFKKNKITIFPQTFYSDNAVDTKRYQLLFKKNPNVLVFVREKYSYDFVVRKISTQNVMLAPDMVTYLNSSFFEKNADLSKKKIKHNILLCLRNDKEKTDNSMLLNKILKEFTDCKIDYTDTVLKKAIYPIGRRRLIGKKIFEFRKANFVITDRLHGMVFAAIAGTPCVVIGSRSYKVKGVYDWISNNSYIKYIEGSQNVNEAVKNVLESNMNEFENSQLFSYFGRVAQIIGERN